MSNTIRMTESIRESSAASTGVRGRRFSGSSTAKSGSSGWMTSGGNTLQRLVESEAEKKMKPVTEETPSDRSEAAPSPAGPATGRQTGRRRFRRP